MPEAKLEEAQLPDPVRKVLNDFLAAAREAFGAELRSAVLFGSAAEGRLRAASDVNLILVLAGFSAEAAAHLEPAFRFAEAAVRLRVMFLLAAEIPSAAEAFAQKFHDIATRRLVVLGEDPFVAMKIPREALRRQVEQVLLNLAIRLREHAARNWSRDEAMARAVADAVGPIRTCAHSLVQLEGRPGPVSPKAALEALIREPGAPHAHLAGYYSRLREQAVEPGSAGKALIETIELIDWMRRRNI